MPSELVKNVRSAIGNFVKYQTEEEGHIAIDVLRAIKDEAILQMERQMIIDTFDTDPLKFFQDDAGLKMQIERLKPQIQVISCSRVTTLSGVSTIEAVVELSKGSFMSTSVSECIRMTFSFKRLKVDTISEIEEGSQCNDANYTQKGGGRKQDIPTHITYDIDFNVDHGENKRMISIEVYAPNDHPSVLPAIPLNMEETMEEYDDDGNIIAKENSHDETEMSISSNNEGVVDRYAAYADPDNIQEFLTMTGLELNDENSLFFLMTWPFYEHEWDLFGFLLDSVFGADEDEDEDFEDIDE
jgi:hypothetical protein